MTQANVDGRTGAGSDTAPPVSVAGHGRPAGSAATATMALHTAEAFLLFTGRPADPEAGVAFIPGGRHFAAVMGSLRELSARDNPYADWALLRMTAGLDQVREDLATRRAGLAAHFDAARRKGLALAVMVARQPREVLLDFRSPYGFAMAEAVLEFDEYVRAVKSLVHTDRLSDDEGRRAVREMGRPFRALFLAPARWERILLRPDLRTLSRADFAPGADEAAAARAGAARALLGDVPVSILSGSERPRHGMRANRRPRAAEPRANAPEVTELRSETGAGPAAPETEG